MWSVDCEAEFKAMLAQPSLFSASHSISVAISIILSKLIQPKIVFSKKSTMKSNVASSKIILNLVIEG